MEEESGGKLVTSAEVIEVIEVTVNYKQNPPVIKCDWEFTYL